MIDSPAWWGCAMFSLGFVAFPLGALAQHFGQRTWGLEPSDDVEDRLDQVRSMTADFGVDIRRLLIDPLWQEKLDDHIEVFVDHLAELDQHLHPSRDLPYLCFHADVSRTPDATLVLIHPTRDAIDDDDEIEVKNTIVTGTHE